MPASHPGVPFALADALRQLRLQVIGEMVATYGLGEVHVTFSRGQWVGDRWGSAPIAMPQGVELWAWFMPSAGRAPARSPGELRAAWRGLTNSLAGLLGSSINFLDSDTQHAHPKHSARPSSSVLRAIWGGADAPESHVFLGSLPREVACTENLTPWGKMLPCRQRSGLASLVRVRSAPPLSFSLSLTSFFCLVVPWRW